MSIDIIVDFGYFGYKSSLGTGISYSISAESKFLSSILNIIIL